MLAAHEVYEARNGEVGGQTVTCSSKVASDYNCSLVDAGLQDDAIIRIWVIYGGYIGIMEKKMATIIFQ